MSEKRMERNPSKTALFTTISRAIANREFNDGVLGVDCLAEAFLPFSLKLSIKIGKLRARIKHKIPIGMYEYLLARTAWFDSIFIDALNRNVPNIVLLGAGYDTRAYRFATLIRDTRIIELDAPLIQNRKKECLCKAHIPVPDNVVFAPIDFEEESLGEVLGKAGYTKNEKTLFLMEGVTYYLDPESVAATLEFARSDSHTANAIGFDYILSVPPEKLGDYYGVRELSSHHEKNFSNERGKFFIEEGAIKAYLEQRGLKIVEHLDNREIEKRFLTDRLGSLTGRVTGWFRMVLASPISKPHSGMSGYGK